MPLADCVLVSDAVCVCVCVVLGLSLVVCDGDSVPVAEGVCVVDCDGELVGEPVSVGDGLCD